MNASTVTGSSDGKTADPRSALNPEAWVAAHGDGLFRHALARLGRHQLAEDLVQETFLAAWKSAHRFAGLASERTWLVGILKKKIADHYRRQRPEAEGVDIEALADFEQQQFRPGPFGGRRSWSRAGIPSRWQDPRQSLEQEEFWSTLHQCTHKLPRITARAFLLRELDGRDSQDICRELGIRTSNLFVMLHRARLALRRCLEQNWFQGPALRKRVTKPSP